MLVEQKLVRNGNSIQVTIARHVLHTLEWLPNIRVWVRVLEELGPNSPCPICHRALPETFPVQERSLLIRRALEPEINTYNARPVLITELPRVKA